MPIETRTPSWTWDLRRFRIVVGRYGRGVAGGEARFIALFVGALPGALERAAMRLTQAADDLLAGHWNSSRGMDAFRRCYTRVAPARDFRGSGAPRDVWRRRPQALGCVL